MALCYVVKIDDTQKVQTENSYSFIGGLPRIPKYIDLPLCNLCGAEQSFMFQIAFPKDHIWEKMTMGVFACTSCARENYFIPEMLKGMLKGAKIPEDFLEDYQKNFRIIIFKTDEGVIRQEYKEKVMFKYLKLEPNYDLKVNFNKVGGIPNWLLGDEAPESYNKIPMFFLMQILENFEFEKLEDAPPQVVLGLSGKPMYSPNPFYELFVGNNIYFFGTIDRKNPTVYVLTQI